jgi:hypothetical protein
MSVRARCPLTGASFSVLVLLAFGGEDDLAQSLWGRSGRCAGLTLGVACAADRPAGPDSQATDPPAPLQAGLQERSLSASRRA